MQLQHPLVEVHLHHTSQKCRISTMAPEELRPTHSTVLARQRTRTRQGWLTYNTILHFSSTQTLMHRTSCRVRLVVNLGKELWCKFILWWSSCHGQYYRCCILIANGFSSSTVIFPLHCAPHNLGSPCTVAKSHAFKTVLYKDRHYYEGCNALEYQCCVLGK